MFTLSCCGGWIPGDYYEKFAKAKKLGFDAIEILSWRELDLLKARKAIDEAGITLTAILTQSKNDEIQKKLDNRHGIVYEDTYEGFITAVTETVKAAKALNCPNVIVVTGNERHDISRGKQHDNIVKALKAAGPIAEKAGITLILEPLNILVDHMGYYLVTSKEGVEIIKETGSPAVKLLFDVYHQQISEGNIINNLTAYMPYIGHIHLGDVPGRKQPGTGEINYKNVFKAVNKTGYSGYAALECGLTVELETGCKEMLELVKSSV